MSTQRGNVQKRGPPKHQNRTAFKNDMHDRTPQMKMINNLILEGICKKCKDVIDWKIKYKKYKPLTVPKKCTKCSQKTVKQAYYVMCVQCATDKNVCAKCGQSTEIIAQSSLSTAEQMALDSQLQMEIKMLPERKRRQYYRLKEEGKLDKEAFLAHGVNLTEEENENSDNDDNSVSDDDKCSDVHCTEDKRSKDSDKGKLQEQSTSPFEQQSDTKDYRIPVGTGVMSELTGVKGNCDVPVDTGVTKGVGQLSIDQCSVTKEESNTDTQS